MAVSHEIASAVAGVAERFDEADLGSGIDG